LIVPKANRTSKLHSLSLLNDVTFIQFAFLGYNLKKKMESELEKVMDEILNVELVLLSTFCLP